MAEKRPTKDSVLLELLQAHGTRQKRSIDGVEHEYFVFDDGCELCEHAREVLHIKTNEQEIEVDSDPPKLVNARRTVRRRRRPVPDQRPGPHPARRSRDAAEGDATPAGYEGYRGPDLLQDRTMTTDKPSGAAATGVDPKNTEKKEPRSTTWD
jgi:hypothetical protein